MVHPDIVTRAYDCLKSHAYHDNFNFFLKADIALFENTRFRKNIIGIAKFLNSANVQINTFSEWLDKIDVNFLPKKFEKSYNLEQENKALFLSNQKISNKYIVNEVHYLISAPIPIHIIETMWSIIVGSLLDESLSKNSYGNRVHNSIIRLRQDYPNQTESNSNNLFERYIDNYTKWRDQGINKAIEVVNTDNKDVAIFSLDLKGFYYNIDIDFNIISNIITETQNPKLIELSLILNDCLKKIHEKYKAVVENTIGITHLKNNNGGIPIGMTSSAILSNWYLKKFDDDVEELINPIYYGRYVDDMIFVLKSPKLEFGNNKNAINDFISNILRGMIVESEKDKGSYLLAEKYHSLPIQKDKLILHYFDKNHSLAGLQIFKKELENRSSAFRFLPDEHIVSDLDTFAYDILYDGSANKFRSIVGLVENETELSKYLSSHTIAHRLCKLPVGEKTLQQIKLFFKGENALIFSRLWEKVISYSLITGNNKFALDFYYSVKECIKKTWLSENDYDSSDINIKIQAGLNKYIDISFCLSLALLDIDVILGEKKTSNKSIKLISEIVRNSFYLKKLTKQFRTSNLIRHYLVSWPLANYTDYTGDLTKENTYFSLLDFELNDRKILRSPRYIHADDYQLFDLIKAIYSKKLHKFTKENKHHKDYCTVKKIKNNKALKLKFKNQKKTTKLKIALANMQINQSSIESACRKDREPDISYERQKNLYKILNAANEENADILLLPELSIPVSWLPFMASHARRQQIALIFGLEHWVIDDIAYNLIVEILPYKSHDKYNSSFISLREKNHYAPSELEMLQSFRLKNSSDKHEDKKYHLISWRGVSFSTYNCFELANIEHRALFRSQIDILFACVWNKDINYYQHIMESAVRDIHCYIAQANTSQYGGSCVLQPTMTTISNKIYVKGGENTCILTTTLDIEGLREAQYRDKRISGDIIKHNPPGFSQKKLSRRF